MASDKAVNPTAGDGASSEEGEEGDMPSTCREPTPVEDLEQGISKKPQHSHNLPKIIGSTCEPIVVPAGLPIAIDYKSIMKEQHQPGDDGGMTDETSQLPELPTIRPLPVLRNPRSYLVPSRAGEYVIVTSPLPPNKGVPAQNPHTATAMATRRPQSWRLSQAYDFITSPLTRNQSHPSSTETLPSFTKTDVRILVVGLTGHGKSSLINKMVGDNVAQIGHGARACQHDKYITKHQYEFNNTTLHIFDTRGLGDTVVTGNEIFQAIRSELQEVDLMLICHKLFERAEEATERMLQQIILHCGKDLLNRSVLCYTKADEYITNIDLRKVKREERAAYIQDGIHQQIESLTKQIESIITAGAHALTNEEFNDIPTCITSDRVPNLPTAPNWLTMFWECCIRRSHEDAASFLNWFARHKAKVSFGVGGIVGGIAGGIVVGATVGGLVGTGAVPIPGVGTAAGVIVGSAVGGAITGIVGGGATGVTIYSKNKKKKKDAQTE